MTKEMTPKEHDAKVKKDNGIRDMNLNILTLKKNIKYYNSKDCKDKDEKRNALNIKACEDEIKMWENKIKTLNGEKTDD